MTDTDAKVGLRGQLGGLIQAQYGLTPTPNIYWSDQRRECQAQVPLIKVYPMPNGMPRKKGLGYGYREVEYRFTIDIKCLNETNAFSSMNEVIRILGHNRLSPFSGYDEIEFSEGNFHAGGAGFYWWTIEATIKVYRKPVAT
jgi:hypothetical protein